MKFLRTASTRRLLSVIAGVILAIVAGSAIAIAAAGRGPVPVRKPLAQAIRSALAAPAPAGISARISFTNNLISGSEIQNPGPLLGGASGRLWLGGNHQMRLELQGENGDAQVLVSQRSFWVYDPQSNTIYEGSLPPTLPGQSQTAKGQAQDNLPTLKQIQTQLGQLAAHMSLSRAIPSDVAGRPTYTVRVSPQHSGGLLGRVELAWDAIRGVPLRFALYASDQSKPVLALQVTHISYGRVGPKVFKISPPKGARVVKLATPASGSGSGAQRRGKAKEQPPITGAGAVAKHLSFPLAAPPALDGLPQQTVRLLDWEGRPAALITYGQNLGGIAVVEQQGQPPSSAPTSSSNQGGDRQALTLPKVTINGATGQELDTAIGTVVEFTRGGVKYTVLTSLPPAAADAAARAL
jgi:outer membrane lipoprotein-sorting protein